MNEYTTIRDQKCPNAQCAFYNQATRGNVVVHSRKHLRLQCKECSRTWVMQRGQPRYGMRTNLEKFNAALQLLEQGLSVRKTAQKTSLSPSTVQRWKKKFPNKQFFNC